VDPAAGNLQMFWKNNQSQLFNTFENISTVLSIKDQKLKFATNAGMFMQDYTPLGLYIENGKTLRKMNTVQEAHGNFYLQPNGVFSIQKNNIAKVERSTDFEMAENINFATQSGPMLVIEGNLHKAFNEGSKNKHYRNGVGILPDGKVLFVQSKIPVNFFDFATYFKNQGCENALYLDGFVSRTYLPEQDWVQNDGVFGVMIGEVE